MNICKHTSPVRTYVSVCVVCVQRDSADSELSRAIRERDELQAMLLGFEKHMEDIQTKVKLLTSERDQLSTQYQQVTLDGEFSRHTHAVPVYMLSSKRLKIFL